MCEGALRVMHLDCEVMQSTGEGQEFLSAQEPTSKV